MVPEPKNPEPKLEDDGPKRAKLLGKKFKSENVVYCYNLSSQNHLRVKRFLKKVDGSGGDKEYAQFFIERVGLDRVRFRNVGYGTTYVVINSPNELTYSDVPSPNAEFYVVKHGRYGGSELVYSFESVAYPGKYIAFDSKGNAREPKRSSFGLDGQFYVRLKKK